MSKKKQGAASKEQGASLASAFTSQGRLALLQMLAARPLKAALFDENGLELSDGLGYAKGGVPLGNPISGADSGYAFLSFQDPQWPSAGFMGASQMRIVDAETGIIYASLAFAQPLNGQGATFRVELPPRFITL